MKTETCWLWQGYRDRNGYGKLRVGSAPMGVHRLVYEMVVGPIPEGLVLDHLCRNPPCCNPDHLEPVTPKENTLRGAGFAAQNAAKTHCVRGHAFSPENTRMVDCGRYRCCLACQRMHERNRTRGGRS